MNNRLYRLRQKLKEFGVEAALISQTENRRYISGFDSSAGYLIIARNKAMLATDFRYVAQAQQQVSAFDIFYTGDDIDKWLPDLADSLGLRCLGFEATDISLSLYKRLSKALENSGSKLELVPMEMIVESLRAVKESSEIEVIKKAVAISDAAMDFITNTIQEGMTEIEVAWQAEKYLRQNGSQPIPFDIIIASGPNAAMPHARPSQRTIKNGETVIIDLGAKIDGYASDISRTICMGEINDIFKKLYCIVLEAQQAAIDGITDNTGAAEADRLARRIIEQAGYNKEFGHSLGHGLGLAVHEKPHIGFNSEDKLRNGMLFTIEPGIYIPNWGGIRIEDTVLLKNGSIEVLSRAIK